MENMIKDLKFIMAEVEEMSSRAYCVKYEIECNVDNNTMRVEEGEPKVDVIKSLFKDLVESGREVEDLQGQLNTLVNKIDTLLNVVGYEAVAQGIR